MTIRDLLRQVHSSGGEIGVQIEEPNQLWGKGLTVDLHQLLKANRQLVVDLLKAQRQREAEPKNEQLIRLVDVLLDTEIPKGEDLVRDMRSGQVVTARHFLADVDIGGKPS